MRKISWYYENFLMKWWKISWFCYVFMAPSSVFLTFSWEKSDNITIMLRFCNIVEGQAKFLDIDFFIFGPIFDISQRRLVWWTGTNYESTVSAQIRGRRLIKKLGFYGEILLNKTLSNWQILLNKVLEWRFNQEWPLICADTVVPITFHFLWNCNYC